MLGPEEIAEATGGSLYNQREVEVRGFSIDTRTIGRGEVFVPLPGSNTDGHKFIGEAYEKGAVASLASSEEYLRESCLNMVVVEDTEEALLRMARHHRESFDVPVVGVTGSYGKTTTKELLSSILSTAGRVHKSPGNYNTEYGLPLALLEMEKPVDFAVLELGLQHPGDVEVLSKAAKPTTGVITGVGSAHLGNFSGVREIAREKLKLTAGMEANGTLVINADSPPLLREATGSSGYRTVKFARENRDEADYWISGLRIAGTEGTRITINKKESGGGSCSEDFPLTLETGLNSSGNAGNVLAAVSTVLEMDLEGVDLIEGVKLEPLPQRLSPKKFPGGTVIDDTYNANPDATRNALSYLSELKPNGKKILVFGDMMELGEESRSLHRGLAGPVEDAGLDEVLVTGEQANALAEELRKRNFVAAVKFFESKSALISELEKSLIGQENVVLVKGSRGMGMEKIVSYLVKDSS